jgi:hypothetical protein
LSTTQSLEPLPRCCDKHSDWQELAEHLVLDFTEVEAADVVRELARAKDGVMAFGLSVEEELEMGELMARHQLSMLAGRIADIARLDPERHVRGSRSEDASASA